MTARRPLVPGVTDLATTHPHLVKSWHHRNDFPITRFQSGSSKRAWWMGECGHEWNSIISQRASGAGCPICFGRRVLVGFNDLLSQRPDVAAWWDVDSNGGRLADSVTVGSQKMPTWRCPVGHTWKARVSEMTRRASCSVCDRGKLLSGFNDLATTHPELIQWWLTSNAISPSEVKATSTRRVWWTDECGHEWMSRVSSRAIHGWRCTYCFGQSVLPGFNDLATTHPELIKEWSSENLSHPSEVRRGSGRVITWKCPSGHSWDAPVSERTKGSGCPHCFPVVSKFELALADELRKTFPDLRGSVALPVKWGRANYASVDIVVGKVVIEFDGSYWHKDRLESDERKTRALVGHGYQVVRVRQVPLPMLPIDDPTVAQLACPKYPDVMSVAAEVGRYIVEFSA